MSEFVCAFEHPRDGIARRAVQRDPALARFVLAVPDIQRALTDGALDVPRLDRAFELLMKATILHKGGKIRGKGEKETIGHDKCVRVCLTDEKAKCLTKEQALTIQIVNSLRDAAQHYMLEVSEHQLYLYAQAGVTLYSDLLVTVFKWNIREHVPERVLPVCTATPKDIQSLVKAEFDDIKALVGPKSRKMLQARSRVRALAVIESSGQRRANPTRN